MSETFSPSGITSFETDHFMRTIILIIFAITLVAGVYTAYNILSFEPEMPAPLVFKEPDPATLKALGIYGEVAKAEGPKLSQEQMTQSKMAVDKISEAIAAYRDLEDKATPRLKTTLSIMTASMSSGRMPAYFLNVKDIQNPERKFSMLTFNPKSILTVQEPQTSVTCADDRGSPTNVLIGDDGPNTLSCDSPGAQDQIFLGGPGNDTINDGIGNRIINAGSGDDNITLGPGRSIVILEDGWGRDTINVNCAGVPIAFSEIPTGFPVPWVGEHANFIVLSPRINPSAVTWDATKKILKNDMTGDTLTVTENCFTGP